MDGLALFILGRASGLTMIVIASVFKALGQGSGQLTIQAEALKKLPPERSGIASSTYYVGADVGHGTWTNDWREELLGLWEITVLDTRQCFQWYHVYL